MAEYLNTMHYNYLTTGGRERERFFEDSLRRLRSASIGGFGTLINQCEVELQQYSSKYSAVIVSARADKFHGLKEHPYSVSILPSEYAMYAPLATKGDGNCLYRLVKQSVMLQIRMLYLHPKMQVSIYTVLWR